jgi:hypothetical protein
MGKKFAQRQQAINQEFFNAGLQMGRQQILDMMCLSLHDPKVVGKDTFGGKRLMKLIEDIGKKIDYYHPAFIRRDDTDAFRVGLDNALAYAFGQKELHDSFEKRYEFCPEFDYKNSRWKK